MSRFATVNLLAIEDSMGDRAPGIQLRFGRKHLDSRDVGISHMRCAPDVRSQFAHSHREQEEAYVVVAGSGRGYSTARSSNFASGRCARRAGGGSRIRGGPRRTRHDRCRRP
jgi:mannose-6-phosphate isomerase-like protein (cupin superfamily)